MKSTKPEHLLALALLALTWGSSFILMKYGMFTKSGEKVLEANQVAALRLLIAGIVLLPISISGLRKVPKEKLKWIALVGLVGSGLPSFLFTNAQRFLDSSLVGIMNSLTPLFTLVIGIAFFKRLAEPRQTVGILIGLAGAVGLISLNGFGANSHWEYSFLILAATISYGLSANTVQSKLADVSSLHITSISLLMAAIPAGVFVFSGSTPEIITTHHHGWYSFAAVATLAVVGTATANIFYFWLTQQTSALVASSVTYLIPIVAVFWGVTDGEHLNVLHLICGLIVLSGVWLVSRKKKVAKTSFVD
ncbi:MAG: DMT family transporter [Flavobacteriales bacterium]